MNRYQEEYNRKKMSARQVLENIQSRDFVFTPMAASCPDALMGELQHLKDTGVKDVILQSCIPSVDYPVFHDPEMKAVMAHHGWFFTAGLRKANAQRLVSAVPPASCTRLWIASAMKAAARCCLRPYLPWTHGAICPFPSAPSTKWMWCGPELSFLWK